MPTLYANCALCGRRKSVTWFDTQWVADADGNPRTLRYTCPGMCRLVDHQARARRMGLLVTLVLLVALACLMLAVLA